MNEWNVMAVAATLALAGILEIVIVKGKWSIHSHVASLGFFMLSARLWFLVFDNQTESIARLNIWGMGPIAMLGVARVYYCTMLIRSRLA